VVGVVTRVRAVGIENVRGMAGLMVDAVHTVDSNSRHYAQQIDDSQ